MSTTTLNDGRTTVTSAGTRVQLSATDTPILWVTVTALPSNTNLVYVGGATALAAAGATERGVPLNAGDSTDFDVNNLTDVWLDSRVNGEGVLYTYGK